MKMSSYSLDTEESHCILPQKKRTIDWWDYQCIQFEQHEHSLVYHVESSTPHGYDPICYNNHILVVVSHADFRSEMLGQKNMQVKLDDIGGAASRNNRANRSSITRSVELAKI